MSVLTASATELARRIREGDTTSRAVVDAHIEQVQRVNSGLNAVVADRFEAARAEADAADAAGFDAERPFHGVPCTIKECFALESMPQTSGLVSRRAVRAFDDAPTVARLRRSGAIPLGVTNVSELCMWMEADNRVYGRTRNPYDHRHTAGGSSGGEAAIIAAGGSPFGLGSDIGGSIRMPAYFCGVFGHKPSSGLIPNAGQYPDAENEAQRYLSTGPLARRAEDLRQLVEILSQESLDDPVSVASLDVVIVDTPAAGRTHPDVSRSIRLAAAALEARGARVRSATVPDMASAFDIWSAAMHEAADTSFRDLLADGDDLAIGRELGRLALGRSVHTLPALGLALVEHLPARLTPKREKRMLVRREQLQAQLTEIIGRRGVLLFPPYPTPAPRHMRPLLPPIRWAGTAIFNVLEMPVTQVPTGLNRRGVPLGVQVAGVHGNDHLTISVACALERELGGWQPPSGIERAMTTQPGRNGLVE